MLTAAFAKFQLNGRTALVTGGSMGLGYAMARALAAAGARVMIVGRRADLLANAAQSLKEETSAQEVLVQKADLYDAADVERLASTATAELGGVDIFVGNAGAVHAEQIGAFSRAEIGKALQLNLVANIMLTQAFVPHMKEHGWGRILFSSSTASFLAAPLQGNITYASAKAGINAFVRALAGDLGRFGITANVIILGVFWTDILKGAERALRKSAGEQAADELVQGFADMTAVGRLGEPADVEGLVQLLASDAGGYITGAGIPLEGGTSIMMRPFPSEPLA